MQVSGKVKAADQLADSDVKEKVQALYWADNSAVGELVQQRTSVTTVSQE